MRRLRLSTFNRTPHQPLLPRSRARLRLHALEDRAVPATFTVTDLGDAGIGSGTSGDLRFCIQQAEDEINFPGADVINISLKGTITQALGTYNITTPISIVGPGSADLKIDGQGLGTIFTIAPTANVAVNFTGLTIFNGFSGGAGGGMLASVTDLKLTDVVFDANVATTGGAALTVFNTGTLTAVNSKFINNSVPTAIGNNILGAITTGGTVSTTMTDCLIDNNTMTPAGFAPVGGGIGSFSAGNMTLTRVTISNNKAYRGGAIYQQGSGASTVTQFIDCSFLNNDCTVAGAAGGGALYMVTQTGTMEITGSTIANNKSSNSGGAMAISGTATVTIRNSTISGNVSGNNGGAIRTYSGFTGKLNVLNSTVTLNKGSGSGGGISRGAGTITLISTILAQNTAPTTGDITGPYTVDFSLIGAKDSGTATEITAGKTIFGTIALPADAKLQPLANNGGLTLTHLPGTGSPVRNAGSNPAPALTTDQRGAGFPRVLESQIDMGSVESTDPTPTAKFNGLATVIAPGSLPNQITVTYTDTNAIDASTIDVNDISIAGPGGPLTIISAVADVGTPGSPRVATYAFNPPGGAWDVGDNGSYTVTMNANQVFDTDVPTKNAVPAQTLGLFFVGVPTTFVVNAKNDEAVDTDGKTSLREAILAANKVFANDVITFDPAVFTGATTIPIDVGLGPITVTDSVTIKSPGVPLTLDGQAGTRIMTIDGTGVIDVSMDGLTFANANALTGGGAIQNNGENVTINNGQFLNNTTAEAGSAIQNSFGNLTVSNTKFDTNTGNAGFIGGAVIIIFGSSNTFTNCTFTNNSGGAGGAVGVIGAPSVTFDTCTMTGNLSNGDGGAVWSRFDSAATLNFIKCNISGNTAQGLAANTGAGGAMYIGAPSQVTISGSTISGNTATNLGGGGIYFLSAATLVMTGSTVSGNTAGQSGTSGGGGINFYNGGNLTMTGSTVSGNTTFGTGGGLYAFGKFNTFLISNSTFSGNQTSTDGGGIHFESFNGAAKIQNSTIAFNKTGGAGLIGGGGISINLPNVASTFTLSSTLVAQNVDANSPDVSANAATTVAGNNNLIGVSDTGLITYSGTGNKLGTLATPLDAKLDPTLALNGAAAGTPFTHALLAGSPAIDQGNNDAGLLTDQRVAARTFDDPGTVNGPGGATDIGAYEFGASFAAPPTVSKVEINNGVGAQRSMVTNLKVTFSEAVNFPSGINAAFQLNRVGQPSGGPSAAAPLGSVNINAVQSGNVVTITFLTGGTVPIDLGGSLIDGLYQLTIVASKVLGAGGQLDGDGNGTGGDNFVSPAPGSGTVPNLIFRLFGDSDGDRDVDAINFGQFRGAFGSADPTFDFDADGDVDAADFGQFRARFGSTV
jgi:hypothetical protein